MATKKKKKAAKKVVRTSKPVAKPKVSAIPAGYEGATPYIICDGASTAIEFYKRAFGAKETMRFAALGGTIGHAEIKIGRAIVMLSDEWPEGDCRGPLSIGGSPVSLMVYVKDVDALAQRAVAAGALLKRPPTDQFYGDRSAEIEDPFGHRWHFSTHIEDVSPREMKKRAAKMFAG